LRVSHRGTCRIIHNWDFRKYRVCNRSYRFIKDVRKSPSVDLSAYSALATHVVEVRDVQVFHYTRFMPRGVVD